ncbi:hypothetical protein [Pedobacter sp. BMA]|uniref:hypothetical protein n=1 Tax=Pedobacter sp. BMA TaxID=1663685 RepID=UPI000AE6DEA3|nr:hypothetical protein [Pedobacter sp. BMA]
MFRFLETYPAIDFGFLLFSFDLGSTTNYNSYMVIICPELGSNVSGITKDVADTFQTRSRHVQSTFKLYGIILVICS